MKYIIIFLLLSLSAAGQQEFFHAQNKGLLLDEYPNAAAAYSLRRVNSRYTGALIRVRRDSTGQAEHDIGSIGEALDTVALKAFIRNNSGYVTTWYDQSGNARNATQTTAANQPRIVNAGAIDNKNGRPAMRFSNTVFLLSYKFAAPATNWAGFMVQGSDNSTGGNGSFYGSDGNGFNLNGIYLQLNSLGVNRSGASAFIAAGSLVAAKLNLMGIQYYTNNTAIYWYNNSESANTNMLASGTQFTIGSKSNYEIGRYGVGAGYLFGYVSEHIIYQSDITSNRAAIKSNINQYYAIY